MLGDGFQNKKDQFEIYNNRVTLFIAGIFVGGLKQGLYPRMGGGLNHCLQKNWDAILEKPEQVQPERNVSMSLQEWPTIQVGLEPEINCSHNSRWASQGVQQYAPGARLKMKPPWGTPRIGLGDAGNQSIKI